MKKSEVLYYEFEDFLLNLREGKLLRNGKAVNIAKKNLDILILLLENRQQVVSKEMLFEQIWSEINVEESTLTQHIYVLRKTFKENGAKEGLIETVPRLGYRLTAEVKEISIENNPQEVTKKNLKKIPAPRYWLTFTAIFLIMAAFAGYYLTIAQGDKKPQIKSIAVLPFKQINAEKEDKMGIGMADILISQLNNLEEIKVTPTSAVADFSPDENLDVFEIGRKLDVDAVLFASTQCDNGVARVTFQIYNVKENSILLSEKFDEIHDATVFELQDRIVKRIYQKFSHELSRQKTTGNNS